MPEIIRKGDSTNHGGKVIEGSAFDICMGKPIVCIGHKVKCSHCKGIFSIIGGTLTTTLYGQGVAGMKKACGAILIASQFTDILEYSGGHSAASSWSKSPTTVLDSNARCTNQEVDETGPIARRSNDRFILKYTETGLPIAHAAIYRKRKQASIICTPFIRDYWFWAGGKQVAVDCGGRRFAGLEILYDNKTLKELASFDQTNVPLNKRPHWSSDHN